MEIEKLLQIDTDQSDKIGMILSNNIDLMHKGDACVSIKNWDKLTMEILAWHKLEVKNLALSGVSKRVLKRICSGEKCNKEFDVELSIYADKTKAVSSIQMCPHCGGRNDIWIEMT
jgi:hypothetical protein